MLRFLLPWLILLCALVGPATLSVLGDHGTTAAPAESSTAALPMQARLEAHGRH